MNQSILTARQQKTRYAFMNAVVRLVIERGLDRISVTDIANEADYGRWTFYQYFESKEDVAWATFVHWMTQLDHHVLEMVQHLESPRREYESWRIIFYAFHQQRQYFSRLDGVLVSEWRVRAKEFLIDQFLQHLSKGNFVLIEDIRPEIVARLYVASLIELLEYWGKHPNIGDAEMLLDEFFIFIFKQRPPTVVQK